MDWFSSRPHIKRVRVPAIIQCMSLHWADSTTISEVQLSIISNARHDLPGLAEKGSNDSTTSPSDPPKTRGWTKTGVEQSASMLWKRNLNFHQNHYFKLNRTFAIICPTFNGVQCNLLAIATTVFELQCDGFMSDLWLEDFESVGP